MIEDNTPTRRSLMYNHDGATTVQLNRDAVNRALRTFIQGVGVDILVALALVLYPIFTDAEGWGDFEWRVMGFLIVKTIVVTLLSYVMRKFLDNSGVPTPLPPNPQPAPHEDYHGGPVDA